MEGAQQQEVEKKKRKCPVVGCGREGGLVGRG
jgi:hypothetical protein